MRRIVAELTALLTQREKDFAERGIDSIAAYRRARPDEDPYGDVFLVVDGWGILRGEFEPLEQGITNLAVRGLSYGIHVVLTANRWAEVRPALRDTLGSRYELRLGDPFESEVSRHAAANVPAGVPGRGIIKDNLHFLAALPRLDDKSTVDDLTDGVRALVDSVASTWPGVGSAGPAGSAAARGAAAGRVGGGRAGRGGAGDRTVRRGPEPGDPRLRPGSALPHLRRHRVGQVQLARASGGAGRAMYEPILQRLRDLGTPGIVLSGSPQEGLLVGDVAPIRLVPGRGRLHHRRHGTRLVQTAKAV
ncbi:hypothetical protein GCM10023322_28400 [Rugosimonospora acidiphila]|uniref:FtsK domain-containing protein n=1 Tax=Rugosimonospora acidiphila TaxID=556531 RepID=A0ABP9RT42_9ACTN